MAQQRVQLHHQLSTARHHAIRDAARPRGQICARGRAGAAAESASVCHQALLGTMRPALATSTSRLITTPANVLKCFHKSSMSVYILSLLVLVQCIAALELRLLPNDKLDFIILA